MRPSLRSPFHFHSARDYVGHYFDFRKKSEVNFGYQVFAKEVGLRSASYLQMVIAHKRTLSIEVVHRIAALAKLTFSEHEYFECLALRDACQKKLDKAYYEKRMARLLKTEKVKTVQFRKLPRNSSASNDWRMIPLVALLASFPEGLSLEKAALALRVESQDLAVLAQACIQQGVISGDFSRLHFSGDSAYFQDHKDRSGFQKEVLDQFLSFSRQAFNKSYQDSLFYSHSFTGDPEQMDMFRQEIRHLFSRLTEIGEKQGSSEIVQINVQCFDLLKNAQIDS